MTSAETPGPASAPPASIGVVGTGLIGTSVALAASVAGMRVADVAVRPIYGAAWRSGIHLGTAVHPIPWVLLRSWGTRLAAQWRAK